MQIFIWPDACPDANQRSRTQPHPLGQGHTRGVERDLCPQNCDALYLKETGQPVRQIPNCFFTPKMKCWVRDCTKWLPREQLSFCLPQLHDTNIQCVVSIILCKSSHYCTDRHFGNDLAFSAYAFISGHLTPVLVYGLPYGIGQAIYIFILLFVLLSSSFFFSSPNLSHRRLDVYHTCTHGVALVWI